MTLPIPEVRLPYNVDLVVTSMLISRARALIKEGTERYICVALNKAYISITLNKAYSEVGKYIDMLLVSKGIVCDGLCGYGSYETWIEAQGHTYTEDMADEVRQVRLAWLDKIMEKIQGRLDANRNP